MDYNKLLHLVSELGYHLAMVGAETFRVEESINRILTAYGVESEVFAIPNCTIISIHTDDGQSATKMKRVGFHGNDLDALEKFNNLSRRICAEKPEPDVALQWLKQTVSSKVNYRLPILLIANFLAVAGFCVFFGGTLIDSICAGFIGVILGLIENFLQRFKSNQFFTTIFLAFVVTGVANTLGAFAISNNTDTVIIAALMKLVPGLIFTNAMRDIIFGDTNSGANRIVQVFLVAAGIAVGTGAAWSFTTGLMGAPINDPIVAHPYWVQCLAAAVEGFGFTLLFNIQGPGGLLCVLGGVISWATYCVADYFGIDVIVCYFLASVAAAVYAEIVARIRKCPAIIYLLISLFPLIPGAGIYYATNYLINGEMTNFTDRAMLTISITGVIAVGILIVSTIVRMMNEWKQHR